MSGQDIQKVKLTSKNPRILTGDRGNKLDQTMAEFGPLDGVVYNVNPDINELVGGNQRTIRFKADGEAKVIITHKHEEPTPTGTVAYGYVDSEGERWPYREVVWDKAKHLAAIDIANQNAGEWDNDLRRELRSDLLELEDGAFFDELNYMTDKDWQKVEDGWVDHDELEEPKDDKAKVKRYSVSDLRDRLKNYRYTEHHSIINGFVDSLEDV